MKVAKIENGEITAVGEASDLYPLTVFPASGPTPSQMLLLGCLPVKEWREHDEATETLEFGAPYLDGDNVYTVRVRPMVTEELANYAEQQKELNKQRASALLTASDFYDLPNTANKITNIADITAYRDALRAIALNPPEIVETWPIKPKTEWVV